MSHSDWLPSQAPFELVRRGFAPDQVTAHLEQLEYDLRIATANRDATNQRINELTTQLSSAQAEVDALRAQLDRQALEPLSVANMSDRMQRMIRLAEEEAAEVRSSAQQTAAGLTAEANEAAATAKREQADAAAHIRSERQSFAVERDALREQLQAQLQQMLAEATTHADQLVSTAEQQAEQLRRDAAADSERVTQAATTAARDLESATDARIAQLDNEATRRRKQADEDFDITLSARRTAVNQQISAELHQSSEDARQRIAHAEQRAQEMDAQARAEARRRVEEADSAVGELMVLRDRIAGQLHALTGQLDQVRTLVASAPATIQPLAEESTRPVPEDFSG